MKPEEKARQRIDQQLTAAGWTVQDRYQFNSSASLGVAVLEFPTANGPADYLLVADRNPLGYEDLKVFIYEELGQRDKASLDIFWLRDESLEDSDNLPDPEVLAAEIVENLQAALAQFSSIYEALEGE